MKSSAEHFFPGTSKSGESIKYCAFSSPNDTEKKVFSANNSSKQFPESMNNKTKFFDISQAPRTRRLFMLQEAVALKQGRLGLWGERAEEAAPSSSFIVYLEFSSQ